MIRAGTIKEIDWESGNWIFLDIGFSNKSKSCGLLVGGKEQPNNYKFNEAVSEICNLVRESKAPVNLVIEAPLSVAFDTDKNPKGRGFETQNGKTRYWYVGLGCSVMVATTYLLKELSEIQTKNEIRLFEGFVSFKPKDKASNHKNDVLALRESILNPSQETIVKSSEMKLDASDSVCSAFKVSGMDYGIPPIIKNRG